MPPRPAVTLLTMRTALASTLAAVLLAVAPAGCQRAVVDTPNPQPIAADAYDRMYDASITVLRDHGFRVDRRDYRFGRITTHPLDSPTAVEPWRPQNTTASQAWQSTLDHLRRTASVFLEPPDDDAPDGHYLLRVEVLLERHAQPTRRLTGTGRRNVFSSLDSAPEEWRRRGIERRYWEPVGRDPHLEARLMRAINTRMTDERDDE